MKLYLQFGFGMMDHCRELLSRWRGDGGVILSPRDLSPTQLEKVAKDVAKRGGQVLVDPQCYVHAADHHRLTGHAFWGPFQSHSTGGIISGAGARALMDGVSQLNSELGTAYCIVPGVLANAVDSNWFALHDQLVQAATRLKDRPLLATIALGAEPMKDEERIEAIVDHVAGWEVDGFYVVAETPGAYLVEDATWLSNLLVLVGGLKLQKRKVIVGYCSHQMLALATTKVDGIASGTWQNVRAFSSDKFITPEEDEVSRRAKGGWYYCSTALSEFKMTFLDVAKRVGVLQDMAPVEKPSYADPLFSGAVPSGVDWGEKNAFRHYLDALRRQASSAAKLTFDDTVAAQQNILNAAEVLLGKLHAKGVRCQERDFKGHIDVNRAALAILEHARGPRLRREWAKL